MKKGVLFFTGLIVTLINYGQIKVDFAEKVNDFGFIQEGKVASCEFTFENNTEDTVRLASVKPSCGCTSPFWTKDPVAPGESGTIKVNYNSRGRLGEFTKNITVTVTGEEKKEILTIKGFVKKAEPDSLVEEKKKVSPIAVLNKNNHYFGRIERNKPVSYKFVLKNEGKSPLKLEALKSGCRCVNYEMGVTEIAPGESASLDIKYSPRTLGEIKDKVILLTNDVTKSHLEIELGAEVVKELVSKSIMQQGGSFGF